MSSQSDNKKRGSGCFSFIIFIFILIKVISYESKPQEIIGKIDTHFDNLSSEDIIVSNFNWEFITSDLKKKKVSLAVDVPTKEITKAMDILESLYYLTDSELNITYDYETHPLEVSIQYWGGIYRLILKKTGYQIDNLADNLEDIAKKYNWNRNDLLYLCITLIQNIEYKIPGEKLGIIPPIVSIARESGDCDTVSILLYAILDRLGYDVILYYSRFYSHVMLGINCNASGEKKVINNKPYYFLELTSPGWDIGQISPEMNDVNMWYPIEL